jgi:hypothetical protein
MNSGAEAFSQLLQQRRQQLQSFPQHSSHVANSVAPVSQQFVSHNVQYNVPPYHHVGHQSYQPPLPGQPRPPPAFAQHPPIPSTFPRPPQHAPTMSYESFRQMNQPQLAPTPVYPYQQLQAPMFQPNYYAPVYQHQAHQPAMNQISFSTMCQQYSQQSFPPSFPSSSSQTQFPHKKNKNNYPPVAVAAPIALSDQQEYYCEPCDKSFKKVNDYQTHCNTHEKCSFQDCTFTACKKVVSAHFHSTHGKYQGNGYKVIDVEGQKFNLLLGYSPKEIDDWKKQRKLKFPSATRVEEKRKDENDLIQAGGLLPRKSAFRDSNKKNKNNKRKLANGEDSAENDNNCDGIDPSNPVFQHVKFQTDNDGAAENQETGKPQEQSPDYSKKQRTEKKGKGGLIIPKPLTGGGERGSFLQKLFEKEIFYEENFILQCIKYICDSNYFESEPKATVNNSPTQRSTLEDLCDENEILQTDSNHHKKQDDTFASLLQFYGDSDEEEKTGDIESDKKECDHDDDDVDDEREEDIAVESSEDQQDDNEDEEEETDEM